MAARRFAEGSTGPATYRGHMCKRCAKWTFGKCRRCT